MLFERLLRSGIASLISVDQVMTDIRARRNTNRTTLPVCETCRSGEAADGIYSSCPLTTKPIAAPESERISSGFRCQSWRRMSWRAL